MKRKVYYNKIITELLLLSDFIEGKSPRIGHKEGNEMA